MDKGKMKWVGTGLALALFSPLGVDAQEGNGQEDALPDRFALNIGSFFVIDSDTDFEARRSDGLIGTSIDFDRDLSGDDTATVPRIFGYYRFNPHHRIDFSWNKIERDGDQTVNREIEFGDAVFPLDTRVESNITVDVATLAYTWSYYHVDKVELGATIGAQFTRYEFEMSTPNNSIRESKSVNAPLPVIGLCMDYTITPRLHALFDLATFSIELGDEYRGSLDDIQLAFEYRMARNFVFGASANRVAVNAEIDGDDFTGSVNDLYRGGQLYLGLRY